MKRKIIELIKHNQLLLLLMTNTLFSILITVGTTIWIINDNVSHSFIEKYVQSNNIILNSTKNTFYRLGNDVKKIADYTNIPAVETYLDDSYSNPITEMNALMEISKVIERFKLEPNYSILHLAIIGEKKVIQPNGEIMIDSNSEIRQIIKNGKKSFYDYVHPYLAQNGFTKETYNQTGIYYIYPLQNSLFQTYGYLLIFISSNDLNNLFSTYFNSHVETIDLIDSNNQIIASNEENRIGKKYQKNNDIQYTKLSVKLPVYSWRLVSTINHKKLLGEINILPSILLISSSVFIIVFAISYFLLKKLTQPIYQLINKLTLVQNGHFDQKLAVNGSYEIKQLVNVYNDMIDELQKYFDKIIEEEKVKRKFELQALQYQINPHFIYNTLTAIKMLVYEGNNEKVIQALDSFIQLLRSTLSNHDDFHSIEEEEKILKHYIQILKLRYGENIHTTILMNPTIKDALIPKMIIQPLIENAYLHAFNNQQTGNITVFIQPVNNNLQIEILDNGQGFDVNKLSSQSNGLHYTKIGMKNIENKLINLYGENIKFVINSTINVGTSIMIQLPQTPNQHSLDN